MTAVARVVARAEPRMVPRAMQLTRRDALAALVGVMVGMGTRTFTGIAVVLIASSRGWDVVRMIEVVPPLVGVMVGITAAAWISGRLGARAQGAGRAVIDGIARIGIGAFAGAFTGFLLAGTYFMLQGHDTGAALGAMLIGAPAGAAIGIVLGALSCFLPSKK